jgi:hypothetical protein
MKYGTSHANKLRVTKCAHYTFTRRITAVLGLVHHPEFQKLEENNVSETGSVSILR